MVDRLVALRRRLGTPPMIAGDAGIAVVCYLATVAVPVKSAVGDWSLFGLAAVASVPLVWRRRHPVLVAAVVGTGTIGLAFSGAQDYIPLPYGQLVATYTVVALCSPLWRALVTVATAIGVAGVVVGVLGFRPSLLATGVLPFVMAYATGTGARARRDRIAMLEERAGRLVEEREAAAVRERERIAREIHDIVAHSVSLIVVQAEAGAVLAGDRDKALATFDAISATGRDAVTQLDRALGVLRGDRDERHPAPGLGDLPALIHQARGSGIDGELIVRGTPRPIPSDLAAAVYRVAQEALTNTIRHAAARRVSITVDWCATSIIVDAVDDGRGPGPSQGRGGRGLVGMGERVRAFGGTLDTGPGPAGVGFRVTARLPLHTSAAVAGG
jgi:signal transduction histidine kinase